MGWVAALPGVPRARLAGVAAFGAAAEIVGVLTGLPFGRYVYTDRWWPTVPLTADSRFPLLLPFAWTLVAGAAWAAAPGRGAGRVLAGAALATILDAVLMEPVMAGPLGYWRWTSPGPLPGGAPVLNSVGWFGVSLVAGAILSRSEADPAPARWVLGGFAALVAGLGAIG